MTLKGQQWIRKAGLLVGAQPVVRDRPLAHDGEGLDVSEMRFKFEVRTADVQSPNNCAIRIYNLSEDTMRRVRGEFKRVILQAGYEDSYGVIFDGTIKQLKTGKENATDKYLEIYAADGDLGFNFGTVNKTFAAGSRPEDHIEEAVRAMGLVLADIPNNNYTLPRGKVQYGLARAQMNIAAKTLGASWSIQGGRAQMIPLQGYLPGEAVEINAATGMVGMPEQTDQGITVRTLLNPRLRIGGLIRLNNNDVNRMQVKDIVAFNSYKAKVQSAPMSGDGLYRLFAVEHIGDTRGQEWYSDLIALAVNQSAGAVVAVVAGA